MACIQLHILDIQYNNAGSRVHFAGGRIDNPYLGMFTSPDREIADADNSQAYNRFSYALGNPLKYSDPTGYSPEQNIGEREATGATHTTGVYTSSSQAYFIPSAEGTGQSSDISFADGGYVDWKPVVNDDGSIEYHAEGLDNYVTFAEQYGLPLDQAKAIVGENTCSNDVISGKDVFNILETDFLSLDLLSEKATEQRKVDQYLFANDFVRSRGLKGMYSNNMYKNVPPKSSFRASGYISTEKGSVKATLWLELYIPGTFSFDPHNFIRMSSHGTQYTKGSLYGIGSTGRNNIGVYSSPGGRLFDSWIYSDYADVDAIYNRLHEHQLRTKPLYGKRNGLLKNQKN